MFEFNFVIESPDESLAKDSGAQDGGREEAVEDQGPVVDESIVPCGCVTFDDLARTRGNKQEHVEFQKISLLTDTQLKCQAEKYEPELDSSYIYYVDSYRLQLGDEDLIGKVTKTHDVVTGQYEGGLKVWELCIDLARLVYNIDTPDTHSSAPERASLRSFFDKAAKAKSQFSILELGCGHAIPSLAVLKRLADIVRTTPSAREFQVTVYLQDFNKQVIENITFENVKRFMLTHQLPFKVDFRFAYGDWHQLLSKQVLPLSAFNLILTSETIYNAQNYKHLLNLFRACMKSEPDDADGATNTSVTLLAAKSIYFGCGGNLHDFLKLARSSKYGFQASSDLLEQFYRDLKSHLQAPGTSEGSDPEQQTDVTTVSKEIIKLYF